MSHKPTIKIKSLRPDIRPIILLRKRPRQLDDSEVLTLAAIADELTISLLDTKAVFCMINSNKGFSDRKWVEEANRCNNGNGVSRRLYEQQAIYKMYRMPIYRPASSIRCTSEALRLQTKTGTSKAGQMV